MSSLKPKTNVPYTALYRRWRPQFFSQVVGQDHVTRTLQNALSTSRIAHAYLFCGLRGTGKTTMAKLLAKALNCLEGVTEEPCNACRSCLEITEGRSLDVIEIDAASNRGIDEIRDLREKIRYAAASSRYKVYIIDEVHMLTNEAFNALLKTLEEPPPGVVFILATTEVHKLPLTVVSRCQRFEFHLIEAGPLAAHLAKISREMNFSIDEETCILLARLAEGSARDALGLLEQCRAYGGERVVYEEALEILGLAHPEIIYRLLCSVAAENIGDGLAVLNELVYRGSDLHRFLRELILYLRKLLMLQSSENGEHFLADVPGFKQYLLEQRRTFDHPVILEMLEILQQLTFQMKGASQPQFLLELAFLRLVRANRFRQYLSPGDLFRRLEELEEKLQTVGLTLIEETDEKEHYPAAERVPPKDPEDIPPWELPPPSNQKNNEEATPEEEQKNRDSRKPESKNFKKESKKETINESKQEEKPTFSWKGLLNKKNNEPPFFPDEPPPPEPPPEEPPEFSPGGLSSLLPGKSPGITPPAAPDPSGTAHPRKTAASSTEDGLSRRGKGGKIRGGESSARQESDPFLQQVLDLFKGRLINT